LKSKDCPNATFFNGTGLNYAALLNFCQRVMGAVTSDDFAVYTALRQAWAKSQDSPSAKRGAKKAR
jgi:hypothetical protein